MDNNEMIQQQEYINQFARSQAQASSYGQPSSVEYQQEEDDEDDEEENQYVPKLIFSEYIHFIVILMGRACIIAVKYALYSDEHIQILEDTRLSQELIKSQLMAVQINDTNTDNILTRVSIAMKS